MKLKMSLAGQVYDVLLCRAHELAIPLDFGGPQPRAFGLPRAQAAPVEAGEFVGDTRRGGTVNCETLSIVAHGNGTHTECVGHITKERVFLSALSIPPLLPAAVLTVSPVLLGDTDESYRGSGCGTDRVLTAASLARAWQRLGLSSAFAKALVLRLDIPADDYQVVDDHSGTNPPYMSTDAVHWLRDKGCDHLLLELPSVDREVDGGTLPNHHDFFGLCRGESADESARGRTITEMIRVGSSLSDGAYALALQFPRMHTDACPSRPVLYDLQASTKIS